MSLPHVWAQAVVPGLQWARRSTQELCFIRPSCACVGVFCLYFARVLPYADKALRIIVVPGSVFNKLASMLFYT
jgi:hypothetical protein